MDPDRVDALVSGQHLRTRRLGIVIVPGPQAAKLRQRVGLPAAPGLLVRAVAAGSPASTAGVAEGDLVTAVDGVPVPSVDDLWDALDAADDRATVEVTLLRGVDERTVTVTFAEPEAPTVGEPDLKA